jgi:hypothetical protein
MGGSPLRWIVGAGLLDGALPTLLVEGHCAGVVFCGQLQGLFGASSPRWLLVPAHNMLCSARGSYDVSNSSAMNEMGHLTLFPQV